MKSVSVTSVRFFINDKFSHRINSVMQEMIEFNCKIATTYKGKLLTRLGCGSGVKRKYFGFEFDENYRKRILDKIRG